MTSGAQFFFYLGSDMVTWLMSYHDLQSRGTVALDIAVHGIHVGHLSIGCDAFKHWYQCILNRSTIYVRMTVP